MKRTDVRTLRLVVSFAGSILAALVISRATHADAVESGIEVSLSPALEVVAAEDGAKVFAASTGAAIQLEVVAKFSDGSSRDVTLDAATSYVSLHPEAATVDASGRIVIAPSLPTADTAVLVIVSRGSVTAPVALRVTSN
jgi:hypothetical protein